MLRALYNSSFSFPSPRRSGSLSLESSHHLYNTPDPIHSKSSLRHSAQVVWLRSKVIVARYAVPPYDLYSQRSQYRTLRRAPITYQGPRVSSQIAGIAALHTTASCAPFPPDSQAPPPIPLPPNSRRTSLRVSCAPAGRGPSLNSACAEAAIEGSGMRSHSGF